jgi:hypothetical protein
MRFTITPFDDRGASMAPDLVDLAALKAVLAAAATSGQRLHIRPTPRHHAPLTAQEDA